MRTLLLVMVLLMSSYSIADEYHDLSGRSCPYDFPLFKAGYLPMFCDDDLKIHIAIKDDPKLNKHQPHIHLIDKNGNNLLPNHVPHIIDADYATSSDDKHTFIIFTQADGKMGVLFENGVVLPPIYDEITPKPFVHIGHDKFLFYIKKDGKAGYADIHGKIVIPMIYDKFGDFKDGMTPAKKNGKWGIIDDSHHIIMPFKLDFDEISTPQDGLMIISKNNLYGYADITGKVFIPPTYQSAHAFYDNKAIVQNTDGKWGVINKSNQIVIDFIYEHIRHGDMSYEGKTTHYIIKQNDKYGLLSTAGQMILPPIYDDMDNDVLSDGFLKVKQAGKYGLFNEIGTQFTPIIYQHFSKDPNNTHIIRAYLDDDNYDAYRLGLSKISHDGVTNE